MSEDKIDGIALKYHIKNNIARIEELEEKLKLTFERQGEQQVKVEELGKRFRELSRDLDKEITTSREMFDDLNEQIESIKRKQYSLITDRAWILDSMYNEKVDNLESVLKQLCMRMEYVARKTGGEIK